VHGNASLTHTTANASSLLRAFNLSPRASDRQAIPLYPGAARPFCRSPCHAPDIHGSSGLDGTDLLPPPSLAHSLTARRDGPEPSLSPGHVRPGGKASAVQAMRDALMGTEEGTAWLVATGALTNVALLFRAFPEVAAHVKGVSIMGGAIGGGFTGADLGCVRSEAMGGTGTVTGPAAGERCGNTTKWAEFNIYCDPESARSVLSDETLRPKTILCPLDVTHLVLATPAVEELVLYGGSKQARADGPAGHPRLRETSQLRKLLHDLLTFFGATYRAVFGLARGPPLHDPVAVAAVLAAERLEPALAFTYNLSSSEHNTPGHPDLDDESWFVDVATDGEHLRDELDHGADAGMLGRTRLRPDRSGAGVRIPRGLDVARFWAVLGAALEAAEARCEMGRERVSW